MKLFLTSGMTLALGTMLLIGSGAIPASDVSAAHAVNAPALANQNFTELASFYNVSWGSETSYRYDGQAVVTFVDKFGDRLFVEDDSAAITISMAGRDISEYNVGDILTGFEGPVIDDITVPSLIPSSMGSVVSSGNDVTPTAVTISEWMADPRAYTARLLKIKDVYFDDVEPGDVFSTGQYKLYDTAGKSFYFKPVPLTDVIDSAIPTEMLDVVGVSDSAGACLLRPRSVDDLLEAAPVITHHVVSLPHFQTFDNLDNDYDGTSYLPDGWTCSGSVPFITAAYNNLEAVTGTYYMVSPESSSNRDEKAYSAFFQMEGGKRHDISFYLFMPGREGNGIIHYTNFSLFVSTEQDMDHVVGGPLVRLEETRYSGWEKVSASFTPEESGEYCLVFSIDSDKPAAGDIGIEDVLVIADGQLVRPVINFTIGDYTNIMDSNIFAFKDNPLRVYNSTTNATEYLWECEGAEPASTTESQPSFTFPASGQYFLKVTASNPSYQRSTSRTLNITVLDGESGYQGMDNHLPALDGTPIVDYRNIPTFETDPTYDFISSFNHYYKTLGERFTFPEELDFEITSASFYIASYSRRTEYNPEDRDHALTLSFYGERRGLPDEENLMGRKVSTWATEFGNIGTGLDLPKMHGFDFSENPITVHGNFYLALEYAETLPIGKLIPDLPPNYSSVGIVKRRNKQTTIFVKPYAGPEGFTEIGKWIRLDNFDSRMAGYGMWFVLWGTVKNHQEITGMVALGADGNVVFDTRLSGQQLSVSGTHAGDSVEIFNMAGQRVAAATADEFSTSINVANLPKGVYIVNTPAGSRKFIK